MASLETIKKVAKISEMTGFTSLCYKLNKNRKTPAIQSLPTPPPSN